MSDAIRSVHHYSDTFYAHDATGTLSAAHYTVFMNNLKDVQDGGSANISGGADLGEEVDGYNHLDGWYTKHRVYASRATFTVMSHTGSNRWASDADDGTAALVEGSRGLPAAWGFCGLVPWDPDDSTGIPTTLQGAKANSNVVGLRVFRCDHRKPVRMVYNFRESMIKKKDEPDVNNIANVDTNVTHQRRLTFFCGTVDETMEWTFYVHCQMTFYAQWTDPAEPSTFGQNS